MTLLDRIAECHAFDASRYLPFRIGADQVGWIARDLAPRLDSYAGVFVVGRDGVSLAPQLDTFEARSRAVEGVARELFGQGIIARWRDEPYPVLPLDDERREGAPLMRLDRGAVPAFGVRAFGVHLNGFVRQARALRMWVARRSPEAGLHPGKLDQLVAGGLPLGRTPLQTLIEEAKDEANVPQALARRARPIGRLSYCLETPSGVSPATMFIYDLELGPGFRPRNNDGELAGFHLWPLDEVRGRVADTLEFKPNANLVVIDFLLRHGLIAAGDPDFAALAEGWGQDRKSLRR